MSSRGVESRNSDSDSDSDSQPSHIRSRSRSRSPNRRDLLDIFPQFQELLNSTLETQSSIMATPELKSEYFKMVPEFNGETQLLPRFLSVCEKLVNKFYNATNPNDFQNEYLMSSILAKVKGDAMLNISSCRIDTWKHLKDALINAYSDKRDCYTLNIEMVEIKQGNETAFDFYNKIQHLLNLQTAYINTHSNAVAAPILIEYTRSLALRVLLRGLKEPTGSLMRAKNPADLNSALNMLTNDFQIQSVKNYEKNFLSRQNLQSRGNLQNNFRANNQPNRFSGFANLSHNFSNSNRPNYGQNFPPPNTSNNFGGMNRTPNNYTPTPMSISTRNSTRPTPMSTSTTNTVNSQQNRNFGQNQFRNNRLNSIPELHNIDEQFNCPQTSNSDDGAFFQEQASAESAPNIN